MLQRACIADSIFAYKSWGLWCVLGHENDLEDKHTPKPKGQMPKQHFACCTISMVLNVEDYTEHYKIFQWKPLAGFRFDQHEKTLYLQIVTCVSKSVVLKEAPLTFGSPYKSWKNKTLSVNRLTFVKNTLVLEIYMFSWGHLLHWFYAGYVLH